MCDRYMPFGWNPARYGAFPLARGGGVGTGVSDLEVGVDGGSCTRSVLECVGVCPGCRGRDAGREGGVCGRTFCDVLGVGDGVGPFEGGCGGASIVYDDEEGEAAPAGVGGAGFVSRLDGAMGVVIPPR